MAKHRLVWLQNRNTPKVLPAGSGPYKPKPSEGKVVKSRQANAQAQLAAYFLCRGWHVRHPR